MKFNVSILLLLAGLIVSLQGVIVDNQIEQPVVVSDFGVWQQKELVYQHRGSLVVMPGDRIDLVQYHLWPDVITIKIGEQEWLCDGLKKDSIVLCSENEDGTFNVDELK